jgi:hypothetical protein
VVCIAEQDEVPDLVRASLRPVIDVMDLEHVPGDTAVPAHVAVALTHQLSDARVQPAPIADPIRSMLCPAGTFIPCSVLEVVQATRRTDSGQPNLPGIAGVCLIKIFTEGASTFGVHVSMLPLGVVRHC